MATFMVQFKYTEKGMKGLVKDGGTSRRKATRELVEALGGKLVAYYFHRTQRCQTCLAMEAYAAEALREGFSEAFESGELEWQAVNVEESQSEHFVEEYGLTASALVMVLFEDGEQKHWKNLERVWELVGDELQYKAYVEAEALAMLERAS